MSQLAASDGQPGNWEEPGFFLRQLETVRFQENGWQEPYESRGSRGVLRGTGGEIPPVYPTQSFHTRYHHPNILDSLPNKKAWTFNVNPCFLFHRLK
jgi:hypothetical protein